MTPFKDSSEMTGRMSSGYGKTALVAGFAAPAMFVAADAAGNVLIQALNIIARCPANIYRFGMLLWGALLCLAGYQALVNGAATMSVAMFLFSGVMFQTMAIIQARMTRLCKIIYSEVQIQFGLLAGMISTAFGIGMLYFYGDHLVNAGFDSKIYWITLFIMWLVPIAMSKAGLRVSAEMLHDKIAQEIGVRDSRKEIYEISTEVEKRAKINGASHFIWLILTISMTAAYAFITGQIPI